MNWRDIKDLMRFRYVQEPGIGVLAAMFGLFLWFLLAVLIVTIHDLAVLIFTT